MQQMRWCCRFPVVLCPLAGEGGAEGNAGAAGQPLVQITIVQQTGGPRGQIYYPYLSFRVARTLQVSFEQTVKSCGLLI